ncbi:dolichyl-P-Man:Man(7)GlcNAc(2)-PP-dolichol alpha-1,6-mannosyltransferase [Chytridiales sp. JEL 0842]|nr:dolichyl-P-Man:Man(7)GlcNAc(2)-PP-dolichol alpha-1,6-mannosyltransferase [Chytridiales sp. JEL 0842]
MASLRESAGKDDKKPTAPATAQSEAISPSVEKPIDPISVDAVKKKDKKKRKKAEDEPVPILGDLLDLLTLAVVYGHLYVTPFTKVEESFNLQATHDLLYYTFRNVGFFDHFQYPGVVPRTFIGPMILYFFCYTFISAFTGDENGMQFNSAAKLDPIYGLYMARGVLGFLFVLSLRSLRESTERVFGLVAGNWFAVLNLTQFHLMFWGSRTLPNIFALVFMNFATSFWINSFKPLTAKEKKEKKARAIKLPPGMGDPEDRKPKDDSLAKEPWIPYDTLYAIALGTFAALVFRLELVALIGPIILSELVHKKIQLKPTIIVGLIFAALSIGLTLTIDSFFWSSPYFWPELEVFKFNILEGRSKEYGVSPFHAYFTSLLPRIAPFAYPMALYAATFEKRVRRILLPAFIFVTCMSFIGHKEWRFIVYVVPLLNIAAGITITHFSYPETLDTSKEKPRTKKDPKAPKPPTPKTPLWRTFVFLCLVLTVLASASISVVSLSISRHNYPGGRAMKVLHIIAQPTTKVDGFPKVHIDSFTAMNGVSLFLESGRRDGWVYSKNETHTSPKDFLDAGYTHLLSATPKFHGEKEWKVVGHVKGYSRIEMDPRGLLNWVVDTAMQVVKGDLSFKKNDLLIGLPLPFDVVLEPKIYLLQKAGWRK